MTKEEKDAIELLENDKEFITDSFYDTYRITVADKYNKAFQTALKLIEKQQQEISEKDKMIDLMAEELSDFNHLAICDDCEKICEDDYEYNDCKNCIIKYFKNKAKGEMK